MTTKPNAEGREPRELTAEELLQAYDDTEWNDGFYPNSSSAVAAYRAIRAEILRRMADQSGKEPEKAEDNDYSPSELLPGENWPSGPLRPATGAVSPEVGEERPADRWAEKMAKAEDGAMVNAGELSVRPAAPALPGVEELAEVISKAVEGRWKTQTTWRIAATAVLDYLRRKE